MRYLDQPHPPTRRVRVEGRDEVGEVIDEGKSVGQARPVLCLGVLFPSTGEVVYYDASRVVVDDEA